MTDFIVTDVPPAPDTLVVKVPSQAVSVTQAPVTDTLILSGPVPDLSGLVSKALTVTTAPTVPEITRNYNFTLLTTVANVSERYINGFLASYLNEWGAIRGSSPYSTFNDSLVRAIIPSGGLPYAGASGNYIEIQDRRIAVGAGRVTHGRRWSDGRLMRNDGLVTEVFNWKTGDADPTVGGTVPLPAGATFICRLGTSDPVPSWLPSGSLIVRG